MALRWRFELPEGFLFAVRWSQAERLWLGGIALLYVATLAVMIAAIFWLGASSVSLIVMNVSCVSMTGVGGWCFAAARRREARRLAASTMMLCRKCRHPVIEDGDGEHIVCPECGKRELAAQLREIWGGVYGVSVAHWQPATRRKESGEVNRSGSPPSRG